MDHAVLEVHVLPPGRLQDDVAGRCLRVLKRATNVANIPLYRSAMASKTSLDSLDAGVIQVAVKALTRETNRWGDASGDVLLHCAPE